MIVTKSGKVCIYHLYIADDTLHGHHFGFPLSHMSPHSHSHSLYKLYIYIIYFNTIQVLGKGRSDYRQDAVLAALVDAGLDVTPLREWVVAWPSTKQLREDLASSTMYLTLEPSNERQGESLPPMTQLIEQSGISRIVIGCAHPVMPTEGAATLHSAGLEVIMGTEQDDCDALITQYTILANSKLQKNARKHFERHGVVSLFVWWNIK